MSVGAYVTELTAIETQVGLAERNIHAGVDYLIHWSALEVYDRFFGYSPIDPFFVIGADVWTRTGSSIAGPTAGIGAYYHLSEDWSLRTDAKGSLDVNGGCEMNYVVTVGLNYAF